MLLTGPSLVFVLLPTSLFFIAWALGCQLTEGAINAFVYVFSLFVFLVAILPVTFVRRGGIVRRKDGSGQPSPVATLGMSFLSAAFATVAFYCIVKIHIVVRDDGPFSAYALHALIAAVATVADARIVGRFAFGLPWKRALPLSALHGVAPYAVLLLSSVDPLYALLIGITGLFLCRGSIRPEPPNPRPIA